MAEAATATRQARRWISATTALVAAAASATFLLVVKPASETVASTGEQVTATRQATELQIVKLRQLRDLAPQLDDMKQRLRMLRTNLPPGPDLDAFYRRITQIAADTDVAVNNVAFGSPTLTNWKPAGDDAANGDTATVGPDGPAPAATPEAAAARAGKNPVYRVPVSLATEGTMDAQKRFLAALQDPEQRASLIATATLVQTESDKTRFTMTVGLAVFTAPDTGGGAGSDGNADSHE